uniref:CoA-binding domain-containing protein n=1 Tax=Aplanochytrium stocchinoi TaxID=215587 RepID=A0A7S3PE52_9STRA|mmetsp:Transcript_20551/g.24912  ORF Transcript_20551/g.24912 Transcript_20551/m.24912 type:complete len:137 (+) Transcript_20551:14-424(+)|eukprot:CAMPEP_0204843596 /NCGR_PEP_ID=MMETSP1346-20131115/48069_1 /ASSEMBLY_ACC=CAM_ASM_000771 /TAXON_ID=215587 /ORGANISM="Aplanochytrium stocchinoi, Strain GSBS06" /LENGTH=136 /DNA_ID=CAMNT_0051982759 /DNA_START=83 /DNA_END=493 /DNA_ORIENTATION=-
MSLIQDFLACDSFAVVGASSDRNKFGNKCLRKYMEKGLEVVPIHPKETTVEGLAVKQLKDLENPANIGVSIVTPPSVTVKVIEEAKSLGFTHLWLQPGAESTEVVQKANDLGSKLIFGGPCIIVSLDRGEHLQGKM